LPNEAIGVLVGITLPGAIRIGEVEVGIEVNSEFTVRGELSAVVDGHGLDAISQWPQPSPGARANGSSVDAR